MQTHKQNQLNLYHQTAFEITKIFLNHIKEIRFFYSEKEVEKIEDADDVQFKVFSNWISLQFDGTYKEDCENLLTAYVSKHGNGYHNGLYTAVTQIFMKDLSDPNIYKNMASTIMSIIAINIQKEGSDILGTQIAKVMKDVWHPLFDTAFRHNIQQLIGSEPIKQSDRAKMLTDEGVALHKLKKELENEGEG